MSYKISVVIPAYNSTNNILNALQSVFEQSYTPDEIIVVDDGSTDNLKQFINNINHPLIKYLYQENSGPAKARNTGIKNSCGDYIAFLDSDDRWYPDHLSDAIRFFTREPEIRWFCSRYETTESFEKANIRDPDNLNNIYNYFEETCHGTFVHTSAVVIQKVVFNEVSLFIENINNGEDLNMWFRIALEFPLIGYSHNIGSVYIKTRGSITYDRSVFDVNVALKAIYYTYVANEKARKPFSDKLINIWIGKLVRTSITLGYKKILWYIYHRWKDRLSVSNKILLITGLATPRKLIIVLKKLRKENPRLVSHSMTMSDYL